MAWFRIGFIVDYALLLESLVRIEFKKKETNQLPGRIKHRIFRVLHQHLPQ